MSNLSANPLSMVGLQAEDHVVEHFDKFITARELDWKVIHSVVDGTSYDYHTSNTITWVEDPFKNAQMGDIRIFACDSHGRPIEGRGVYIDVKYSRDWKYASISFPKKSDSPKRDAVSHLCGFIGKSIENDFWYMSAGSAGCIFFNLRDVQKFIQSASEEKMLDMCMSGKYNDSWFLSLENLVGSMNTYDLATWEEEELMQRLG